jgi:TldD protein
LRCTKRDPMSRRRTQTIILGSSQFGLQIHESVGHPIELDRVLGMEANFAGNELSHRWISCGTLRYASDIVNVVADARLEHGPGLGTFGYDDEGVRGAMHARSSPTGQFTGYLSQSRDRRWTIGENSRSERHDAQARAGTACR